MFFPYNPMRTYCIFIVIYCRGVLWGLNEMLYCSVSYRSLSIIQFVNLDFRCLYCLFRQNKRKWQRHLKGGKRSCPFLTLLLLSHVGITFHSIWPTFAVGAEIGTVLSKLHAPPVSSGSLNLKRDRSEVEGEKQNTTTNAQKQPGVVEFCS